MTSFRIEGLDKNLASDLRRGLSIPNQFARFRIRGPLFYPQALLDDMKRARLFLARRGYPSAEIKPRFEPQDTKQKFSLIFEVTTGSPVVIDSISMEGFPPSLESEARQMLPLRVGLVFSEVSLEQALASLESKMNHAGFANAHVEADLERTAPSRIKITLKAVPGVVYRFGGVIVEGASADLVPLVKKTASVRTGALYSPLIIQHAQNNLRLLDLFRKIRLTTQEAAPDTLDLHADLAGRKLRTIESGVGYWTDDQIRLHARWVHRNLLRAGRGLSVGGSASRFLQTASVSLWWPALIGARSREVASAKIESQREESYNLLSTGGELFTIYRHSFTTTTRIGISVSNIDVNVKTKRTEAFAERGGLLSVVSFRWTRNGTDDRILPTRGAITWVRTEWAPNGFLSDNHYISLETTNTLYLSLSKRTVFANRITAGAASPTGESVDLLPNKRFYAGGSSSMRGFKRRKLGPLDGSGAPLGGEAKLEASVELRFPLISRLHGALFLDTGQVWSTIDDFSIDAMEIAVGPGLMVQTPVGPIRADIGWRVTDREPTQPRWVFHLSVGHSS
jgi:outer membrane protein assembly complex protein YaeT